MADEHPGLSGRPIYLDYNATTPVDPRVVAAMAPFLTTEFGNPSSSHEYGQPPRDALLRARRQVAALIGASGAEIVFTGAGPRPTRWTFAGPCWPPWPRAATRST
jgi:cysteine desulfurase